MCACGVGLPQLPRQDPACLGDMAGIERELVEHRDRALEIWAGRVVVVKATLQLAARDERLCGLRMRVGVRLEIDRERLLDQRERFLLLADLEQRTALAEPAVGLRRGSIGRL